MENSSNVQMNGSDLLRSFTSHEKFRGVRQKCTAVEGIKRVYCT